MTRPPKDKIISFKPKITYFKPRGVYLSELEEIELSLPEMETLRLIHAEGMQQTQAAQLMGVHQSTLQRILAKAEEKTAKALLFGHAIKIGNA